MINMIAPNGFDRQAFQDQRRSAAASSLFGARNQCRSAYYDLTLLQSANKSWRWLILLSGRAVDAL